MQQAVNAYQQYLSLVQVVRMPNFADHLRVFQLIPFYDVNHVTSHVMHDDRLLNVHRVQLTIDLILLVLQFVVVIQRFVLVILLYFQIVDKHQIDFVHHLRCVIFVNVPLIDLRLRPVQLHSTNTNILLIYNIINAKTLGLSMCYVITPKLLNRFK